MLATIRAEAPRSGSARPSSALDDTGLGDCVATGACAGVGSGAGAGAAGTTAGVTGPGPTGVGAVAAPAPFVDPWAGADVGSTNTARHSSGTEVGSSCQRARISSR